MAFKNALKNLVAHFGTVWALLMYMLLFAALITGLSLPFVLPIVRVFEKEGVIAQYRSAFSSLFGEGGWNGMWDGLFQSYSATVDVFKSNDTVVTLTMLFLIFIAVFAFRFFLGLHEIPLATVIDGKMSCNARYGLGGKFFSTLTVSARYSLAKTLVTALIDAAIFGITYGLCVAVGVNMLLPFVIILSLSVLMSFKNSLLSCWAPCVADGCGIVKGFGLSIKICFKRFGSIYSTYLVSFMLILAIGAFVTLFTLGVGLLIVLPVTETYMGYLNATEYYNKTGKRYYVDETVFTPPTDNVL